MVEANVGLVKYMLHRWLLTGESWDDAYQDGLVGLMRAVQLFEPARGFRFSTFAQHWIRAGVQQGRYRYEGVNFRRADGFGGNHPKRHYLPPLSLDVPLAEDTDSTFADLLQAPDDPEADALGAAGGSVLADALLAVCRNDLDRQIIDGLAAGKTRTAIGEEAGVSHQAISTRVRAMSGRARHPVRRHT